MKPPDGENVRTVGCALAKLIPDPDHLGKIRDAVLTTHKATILASELLNLHIRRMLDVDPGADLKCCFDANWVLNAYNEVTVATKKNGKVDAALRETRETCMPPFDPPMWGALQQCLQYETRNLVTVATNNVWMHFQKRLLSHVRTAHKLTPEAYWALTKDERRHRKLELMQMSTDLGRAPGSAWQSPAARHAWVTEERARLGVDAAVGSWGNKPLLYHLKARPHRFLHCMRLMLAEREAAGAKAFALYPLRRTNVPRHARFDQKALRDILGIGQSDDIKASAKLARKRKCGETPPPDAAPLPAPSKRRSKAEMAGENASLFSGIVDLRAAGVQRPQRFDFAFTTDGVCARVQMRAKDPPKSEGPLTTLPKRGLWSIDQLKHVASVEEMHVVGVDPGKRELVVCVDMDDSKKSQVVRYTQKQRQRDQRSRQYAVESERDKPCAVADAEAALAGYNSRSAVLDEFQAYCAMRRNGLEVSLAFYADLGHRQRRWKTAIKTQQSEERLYKRIEGIKKQCKPGDERPLVLAYGSWGLVAGRSGMACNKGNPPTIGVGLMRKLALRFVVALTPEAYTSKTCCVCLGECGPWKDMEAVMGKEIRGLRRCTQ